MQAVDGRPNKFIKLFEGEPKPGSTPERLLNAYLSALDSVDTVAAQKAEASASGTYTPQGMQEFALNAARSQVPHLKAARNALAKASDQATELHAKLQMPKPDPAGAPIRAEIRGWLRAMSAEDRDKYLSGKIDKLSPEIVAAIFEGPPELVGNPPASVMGELRNRALRAAHGELVDELAELEAAIEVTSVTLEAAETEVQMESGVLDPRQWQELTADVKPVQAVPYLKKSGEKTLVLEPHSRGFSSRQATAEEFEAGQFFKSVEDYRAANAAA